ncbi:hypothetical protein [Gracilinema caldarium]|uniref:hypothetical protein n=1 Tax=Gracilinema caldarium TaxID=215591 RepID=UPI0026E9C4EC|nr:hypothetical protein [Gracilinema caldarium]
MSLFASPVQAQIDSPSPAFVQGSSLSTTATGGGGLSSIPSRQAEEASPSLFNLSRNDSSVNLLLQGAWEAGLTAQGGLALTDLGLQAAATNNPLLFTQKADLTLSLWIQDRWFLEASFLDNYDLNTYRAGYQGTLNEKLQYAGVGNTGLDFPRFPYLDLGGSSPSSFGFYTRWLFADILRGEKTSQPSEASAQDSQSKSPKPQNSDKQPQLTVHGMVRYDGAKLEEKNYIGSREISTSSIELSSMVRGYSFVLPDENLETVPVLYIEDPKGDQIDEYGARWRLALASEYAASARFGIIEIRSPSALAAGKRLSVAYRKGGVENPWSSSLGTYGDTSGAGANGFLGAAQGAFNSSAVKFALRNYPQPGQKDTNYIGTDNNKPATVTIGGTSCLVIWERGTFSPFERLSRYQIQAGSSAKVQFVNRSAGEPEKGFSLEPLSSYSVITSTASATAAGSSSTSDTASSAATSADVSTESGTASSTTYGSSSGATIYELVDTTKDYDIRSTESRWPLVNQHPELYLPASNSTSLYKAILVTTYGSPGALFIGKDVLPGSVQVYRNGLPDPFASYDSETGEVRLASPPSDQERIRIQYLKRSEERRFGSLSAGIGASYQSGGPFSAELAMGLRWNVSPDAFSEGSSTSPGTVGLSGSLRWDWEHLALYSRAGLFYRQEDTTGIYRILGMEGARYAEPFPVSGFYQSPEPRSLNDYRSPLPALTADNQAGLVYRSYSSTDILGISTLHGIDWDGAQLIPDKTGPYLVSDSTLDTRVLVGEATYTESRFWAGFQVPMEDAAGALAGARQIAIPFRFYDVPSSLSGVTVQVYLQIGALDGAAGSASGSTGSSGTGWENSAIVLTAKIFDSATANPAGVLPTQWQTATLTLSEADRRALAGARALRFVVVTSGTSYTLNTRLLSGPPVVSGASTRPIVVSGGLPRPAAAESNAQVDALERNDSSLRSRYGELIDKLHPAGASQRILEVSFSGLGTSTGGTGAGADSRVLAPPPENYKNLTLFVRGPKANTDQTSLNSGTLVILVSSSLDLFTSPHIQAHIPISTFTPDQWSKLDIQYNTSQKQVFIDGKSIQNATVTFMPAGTEGLGGTTAEGLYQYVAFYLLPQDSSSTLPDGNFAVDEILFTEAVASFQGRGGISVQWNQKGPLLSLNKVPILTDLKLLSSSEGLYQLPAEAPYPSAFANIQNQSSAAFVLLGCPIELRGGITAEQNSLIWNGAHRITLPLGPLEVENSFSLDQTSYMQQGSGKVSIPRILMSDLSFTASLSAQASQEIVTVQRQWKYSAESRNKVFFIASTGDLSYINSAAEAFSGTSVGYSLVWTESIKSLLPDEGLDARSRVWTLGAKSGLELKPLGFSADAVMSSRSQKNLNAADQAIHYGFSFPFIFSPIKGNVGFRREIKQNSSDAGSSLWTDADQYGSFISAHQNIVLFPPVYGLFAPELKDYFILNQDGQSSGLGSLSFIDSYTFSIQAPAPANPWALIFPARVESKIARRAEQNLSNYTDKLSWETSVASSAVNLFGAYGQSPLFKVYRDDEFSQQLSLNFTYSDYILQEWKAVLQQRSSFYGFSGSSLEINNALNLMQTRWSDALSLSWTRPNSQSLLGALFRTLSSNTRMQNSIPGLAEIAAAPAELLQKETLETKIDMGSSDTWQLSLSHESIVRIRNRLTISAFGKAQYDHNLEKNSFTLLGSTGIQIKVQF